MKTAVDTKLRQIVDDVNVLLNMQLKQVDIAEARFNVWTDQSTIAQQQLDRNMTMKSKNLVNMQLLDEKIQEWVAAYEKSVETILEETKSSLDDHCHLDHCSDESLLDSFIQKLECDCARTI